MASLALNDGILIPLLGFGTGTALLRSKSTPEGEVDPKIVETIKLAIRKGYRHLDTAEMYKTEPELGAAIRESIAEGIVKREDLFVTTKVSKDYAQAVAKLDISLKKLGLDYVDLYLVHSPYHKGPDSDLQAAWAAMEAAKASGKTRSIGVSNYEVEHLVTTLATAKVLPSINQMELHPYLPQTELHKFSQEHGGIVLQAYGALHPVTRNIAGPIDDTLDRLAAKYNVSKGLVCMRWCVERGIVVITTTQKEPRMDEFLRLFDFKLAPEEVQEISAKGLESLKGEELVPRVIHYHRMVDKQAQ
ncbi:Aldo/keto reductase [Thozetella sp. PMI_491]|nr:Aldo/keto reductase [Thozetella sp. PMI_491]